MPDRERHYELDILRGVAALLVVVHHWHFLFMEASISSTVGALPLAVLFQPLYDYGELVVDLFFTLSGYVFFWLYSQAIAERRVTAFAFFRARLARLYPLVFATLIITAALQVIHAALYGHAFVYHDNNNALNFLKNLFMIQAWSRDSVQTFNGPSWSISIEWLLYILFFVLCRLRLVRPVHVVAAVVVGVLAKNSLGFFATGFPSFFLGGLCWYAVRTLKPSAGRVRAPLTALTVFLWGITLLAANRSLAPHLPGGIKVILDLLAPVLTMNTFWAVLAPVTVITAVIACQGRSDALKPWAMLGDVSLSVYLLHMPLLIILSLVLNQLPQAAHTALIASPLAMAAFMAGLLGLAKLCHDRFEMPMRDRLRRLEWLIFTKKVVRA